MALVARELRCWTASTSGSRAGTSWGCGSGVPGGGGRPRPAERDDRRDGGAGAACAAGPAGKGDQARGRALARRLQHEVHVRGCAGQPAEVYPHRRRGGRPRRPPRWPGSRPRKCGRSRLRCRRHHRLHRGTVACDRHHPPKQSRVNPRDCDYAAYKERHLVECFIGKLKYFRRVFARSTSTPNALAIHFAS